MKVIKPKFPLYLKHTKERGWGVFCAKAIKKGQVIERAPIIFLPAKLWNRTSIAPFDSYRFSFWGNACALVMGYGSLYNHSHEGANCEYDIERKLRLYKFYATKDIPAHTEILHDYNWDESEYKVRGMRSEKKLAEGKERKLAAKKRAAKKAAAKRRAKKAPAGKAKGTGKTARPKRRPARK